MRLVELTDDFDEAEDAGHQRSQEAKDGQDQVVVKQEHVGVLSQREDVVAGDAMQLRKPVALLDQEFWDDSGSKHSPNSHSNPEGT